MYFENWLLDAIGLEVLEFLDKYTLRTQNLTSVSYLEDLLPCAAYLILP